MLISLLPLLSFGATYTASQSGNWSDKSTWGNVGVPAAGDNVIIGSNWTLTVTLTANTTCRSVTIQNGGTLALNNYNFTSTGTSVLTNQGHITGTASGITKTLSLGSGISLSDGSSYINTTGYDITINGALNCPNQGYISTNGGNLTVNGLLSCAAQAYISTNGGNLTTTGNVSLTNQGNINIGSGNSSIGGNFSCDGTNTYIAWTTGNVTIGGNITYNYQYGTYGFNCTGSGWLVMNGATKTFTVDSQEYGGIVSIPNFRIGSATITKAGAAALTISNTFDLNNQTAFSQSAGTINVTGTIANSGSMELKYTGTPTFIYSGGGNIIGGTYYNLTVQTTDIAIPCGTTITSAGTFTNSRTITGPTRFGHYARIVNTNSIVNSGTIGGSSSYIALSNTITGGTIGPNVLQSSAQPAQCTDISIFSSIKSGNWNDASIWQQSIDGGLTWEAATTTPTSSDYAIIQNGNTVTLTSSTSINNLSISGTLDVSTYTLAGSSALTITPTGTLLVGSTANFPTGFATTALNIGSTINYYFSGAQTISNQSYSNLILSGSGAKTLPATLSTIGGSLTLNGSATAATVTNLTIGGNLTIGDEATFTTDNDNLTIAGTTTIGAGTGGTLSFTSTTGTKIFTGLVTINPGGTWNNSINESFTFRGGITNLGGGNAGTGIYTFDTNNQPLTGTMVIPRITVTGITLTNNSMLTVSTALIGTGNLTQAPNATLYIGGTSTITTLNTTSSGNTVNYNGTIAQTVYPTDYYNLTLSSSNVKTITTSSSISGNLSISGSKAKLNNGVNILANNLILNGTSYGDGTYGSTSATSATIKNDTYFSTGVTGIVTVNSACPYGTTILSTGLTDFTPTMDMASHVQQIPASNFKTGQHFIMNVIKGLTYQIYTTNSPSNALKMTVYEEGNASGSVLAYSLSNTGNPGASNSKDIYLSFTSPLSGKVRIMINLQSDCSSTATTGLTVNVNVSGGNNTQDDPTAAGTDSWIGHIYDGVTFNNYIGYYNVTGLSSNTDTFQEGFGSTGTWPDYNSDNTTGFNVQSNNTIRAKELAETFSTHYRMKSSKRGFYTFSVASDDGVKLYVDNDLVYTRWNEHGPTVDNNMLLSLSGSSSMLLDFFEQSGQNIIGFYNLVQIFSNTLSTNTTQTLCKGTIGLTISGDIFPTLPTGITNQGYQWYYSTAASPTTRIIISGATSATYIPNSNNAPFNLTGTYYLYRVAKLVSSNNFGVSSYSDTNESNPAVIRVRSCPNYWTGKNGTSWQNPTNWSEGIPYDGDDIEFATTANGGNGTTGAENDLILDQHYTIGNLTNRSDKRLIIPASTGIIVNNSIITDDVIGDKILIKCDPNANAATRKPNGSLEFHNASNSPVYATVEMYSTATINSTGATNYQYMWQYFGVPLESVKADPTLYGAYVRKSNESGKDDDTNYYWIELSNSDNLTAFDGYEICQPNPTIYTFKGKLINKDFESGALAYTTGAMYPGEHLFANPYTAAINVDKIEFGNDMDKTVFLYNTGSYGQWSTPDYQTSSGDNPGQYFSIPQNTAGSNGIISQIPSMSSMLVKTGSDKTSGSYIKIKYSDVIVKNTTIQRVKAAVEAINTDLVSTRIDLVGQHYSDQMWIVTEPSCTRNFDNGWDGRKILGSSLAPQIYAIEPDGDYQVNSVSDMHNTDLAFQAGDEVEYTLKFTHENIQRQYAGVYLVDLIENKTVDVTQNGSTYTFATAQSDAPAKRFKILTRSYEKDAPDTEAQVKIFTAPGRVFVQNLSTFKGECTLYDIAGRAIKNAPFAANAVTEVLNNLTPGAYVANTITNGETVSKRVIVQ